MRFYIIAGEASGDLHGANLIRCLKALDPDVQCRCWGGDQMKAQGAEIVRHYRDLAFMGFWEVFTNIRAIWRNFQFCLNDIEQFAPDAIILIDYPGFNLRISEYAKQKGYKVFYYISPQVWAWNSSRVHQIKKYVDRMFVILPFEKEFYARFGYNVDFVGHPLLDAIGVFGGDDRDMTDFLMQHKLDDKKIIALLPGSREQEIGRILPEMVKIAEHFKDYQFLVGGSSAVMDWIYKKIALPTNVRIIYDDTYRLLRCSEAAIVTSGTATLETALHEVPEIVCYKGGFLSYLIAKRLIKTRFISLVNIIMDKMIVKELIQHDLTVNNLRNELDKILSDGPYRKKMIEEMKLLKQKLGGKGASRNAAELVMKYAIE